MDFRFSLSTKKILIILLILVALISVLYFVYFRGSDVKLSIDTLETTDFIDENGDYTPKNSFSLGEKIYVYEEFSNFIVTDSDTKCNLFLKLSINSKETSSFSKIYYYNLTDYKQYFSEDVVNGFKWYFTTKSSWPIGDYEIIAFIEDRLSEQTDSVSTNFVLG